jgi:ATP-binding cassette subfamily C protein EexD
MSTSTHPQRFSTVSELRQILATCKTSFLSAGFFSLFINVLLLAPSLYMLQVYDRVLTSSSESTLLMLTLILVFLFLVLGLLEWLRSQILIVTSTRLDQLLGGRVFEAVFAQSLASGGKLASTQPLSDLLQLRQFLTGQGLFAFFDAPWLPLYITVMFLFHVYFGVVAVISVVILITLAVWNELATRNPLEQANRVAAEASQLTQRQLRNTEVIEAMGMLARLRARWQQKQTTLLALQGAASRQSGLITAMTRTYRLTIQSLILGLGAYLAIRKEITPGLVIAGSILLGRALAPLDQMIGTWRSSLTARGAYQRLGRLLDTLPPREPPLPLPAPKGEIRLEQAVIVPPGALAPVIKGANLLIEPGIQVAIIGPSAAGKSTLARAILGLYRPVKGSVRLDGAELDRWDREPLGQYIGYLPQDVELLDGSISENIARFGTIDAEKVVAAAQAAGIHEMILRLPEGYETRLVGGGTVLSAGQQQRLGIARALYGDPQVIILDEPNANLDQEGDAALLNTLAALKQKGRTVIVITHRNHMLNQVDRILLLLEGQIALYGPREQALAALRQSAAKSPAAPAGLPRTAAVTLRSIS